MRRSTKTPCIGVCSTVFGDEVCRGCKRFQYEVIQWNSFTNEEKRSVLDRLEALKVQIMQSKIFVVNENLLKEKLIHYKIKFDEDSDLYVGFLTYLDREVNLFMTLKNLALTY